MSECWTSLGETTLRPEEQGQEQVALGWGRSARCRREQQLGASLPGRPSHPAAAFQLSDLTK